MIRNKYPSVLKGNKTNLDKQSSSHSKSQVCLDWGDVQKHWTALDVSIQTLTAVEYEHLLEKNVS